MNKALDCRVWLEPLTKEHVAKTFTWISNPDMRSTFLVRGDITWAGHEKYFERAFVDPSQRLYAIVYEGEHVGNCGFKHLDFVTGNGELWIYLGEADVRGKGIGEMATRLLLKEGVENLNLRTMQVHVAEGNDRAYRLYLRVGFVLAGAAGAEWEVHGCRVHKMIWENKEK